LIKKLLIKNARSRLSATGVLAHPWLITASAKTELTTPATMRSHNNVKQLSRFADSAAQVNRVVLQHLSVNLWEYGTPSANNTPPSGDENTGPNGQLASDFHFGLGLSPPTDSKLLQRRKSLQSQSLQLTRFKTPETVLKIQDLLVPVAIASPSCWINVRQSGQTERCCYYHQQHNHCATFMSQHFPPATISFSALQLPARHYAITMIDWILYRCIWRFCPFWLIYSVVCLPVLLTIKRGILRPCLTRPNGCVCNKLCVYLVLQCIFGCS